jgi:hypothetical protein
MRLIFATPDGALVEPTTAETASCSMRWDSAAEDALRQHHQQQRRMATTSRRRALRMATQRHRGYQLPENGFWPKVESFSAFWSVFAGQLSVPLVR